LTVGVILLALTSCSKEEETLVVNNESLVPVTVRVNDFSMSVEDFGTRAAQSVESYTGVKAMTLAFYDSDDVEAYKTTQLRADNSTYSTFGDFSLSLPMGSYTMVVLGYGSESPITLSSKTSAVYETDRVRETFVYTETVNITNTSAVNLAATLSRVVSRLYVVSTDYRTANAYHIRTTFAAGGQGVNPMTGQSTSNTGFSNTLDFAGNTNVGQKSNSVSYLFLNADEQTMNVTIDILDEDNDIISQRVVNNVPFKRNRTTKLIGSLFTTAASSSFQVETSWLTDEEITF
jgi:hypothetical protein